MQSQAMRSGHGWTWALWVGLQLASPAAITALVQSAVDNGFQAEDFSDLALAGGLVAPPVPVRTDDLDVLGVYR